MNQNGAAEESRELLQEEKKKYREKIQLLVRNWAKITSAAVVVLSYIQYSYKYGICKVFHLPVSTVTINLTDYIPAVAILCAIAVYVFDCCVSLNRQRTDREKHFSLFRIICGTAIIFIVLSTSTNDDSISLVWILLISVIPALMLEFLFRSRRPGRIKEGIEKKYQDLLKNDTEDRPLYKYYIKPALIVVLILILIIPFFAEIVTSHRNVYEICTIGSEQYAVILDSPGSVVVQPAVIKEDSLTICTGSYRYASKTDIDVFAFQHFDHVTISGDRSVNDTGEGDGNTAADDETVPDMP